jgi:hypothetical protein
MLGCGAEILAVYFLNKSYRRPWDWLSATAFITASLSSVATFVFFSAASPAPDDRLTIISRTTSKHTESPRTARLSTFSSARFSGCRCRRSGRDDLPQHSVDHARSYRHDALYLGFWAAA